MPLYIREGPAHHLFNATFRHWASGCLILCFVLRCMSLAGSPLVARRSSPRGDYVLRLGIGQEVVLWLDVLQCVFGRSWLAPGAHALIMGTTRLTSLLQVHLP